MFRSTPERSQNLSNRFIEIVGASEVEAHYSRLADINLGLIQGFDVAGSEAITLDTSRPNQSDFKGRLVRLGNELDVPLAEVFRAECQAPFFPNTSPLCLNLDFRLGLSLVA